MNGLGSGINSLGGAIATLHGVTTSGNGWSGVRVSMWQETIDSTLNVGLGDYDISEAFPMWKERTASTVNFVDIPTWHIVDVAISPTYQHYI